MISDLKKIDVESELNLLDNTVFNFQIFDYYFELSLTYKGSDVTIEEMDMNPYLIDDQLAKIPNKSDDLFLIIDEPSAINNYDSTNKKIERVGTKMKLISTASLTEIDKMLSTSIFERLN